MVAMRRVAVRRVAVRSVGVRIVAVRRRPRAAVHAVGAEAAESPLSSGPAIVAFTIRGVVAGV